MYKGPIRIEIAPVAVDGVFTAKAFRSADVHPIATTSNAAYETTLSLMGTALAAGIEGSYQFNPRIITAPNSAEIL